MVSGSGTGGDYPWKEKGLTKGTLQSFCMSPDKSIFEPFAQSQKIGKRHKRPKKKEKTKEARMGWGELLYVIAKTSPPIQEHLKPLEGEPVSQVGPASRPHLTLLVWCYRVPAESQHIEINPVL